MRRLRQTGSAHSFRCLAGCQSELRSQSDRLHAEDDEMDAPVKDTRPVTQRFSGLSDEELEVLGQADRFARAELHPLAQRMDDEEWWPPEAFAKIGATGYFGIPVPEAYG